MFIDCNQAPISHNLTWGFWGTMGGNAQAAWPLAAQAISNATRQPTEAVRLFLDSCFGRHFADTVRNEIHQGKSLRASIEAAIQKWMDWKIDRRCSRDWDVPRGLPYLLGLVIHCGRWASHTTN